MLLSRLVQFQSGIFVPMTERIAPWAASLFLIAAVTAWLATEIPKGILTATDELLTAERTREMLVTGQKSVVQFNFRPSFEKPPLQYWLTTLTLERLNSRSFEVRIWTLFYGALTAIALGWLVILVEPKQPWLVPLSVAVLVACPLFSTQTTRGLLDIGLAFFTTMTIAFAQLARRRPQWWLGAALMCFLGALQKMPIPLLVWLLILIVRAAIPEERTTLRTKWIPFALVVAILTGAAWPLLQIMKYKMSLYDILYDQVVVWTGPTRLGARPYLEIPLRMTINGGALGVAALVAPLVVLFWKGGKFSSAAREIALVSLIGIALAIVSNFRHFRYIIPILPCLCLLVGCVFYRLFQIGGSVRGASIVAFAVFLLAGFIETKIEINHLEGKPDKDDKINQLLPFLMVPKDVSEEKLIAESLGALQRPGITTLLVESKKPGLDLLWDSFYLFHGSLRYPVADYTLDELQTTRPKPPLIGVCVARDFPAVQKIYPEVQVQFSRKQFVCWQVAANAGAESSR